MKKLVLLAVALVMAGCAGITIPTVGDAQKEYTFDFTAPGKSQSEIWKNAQYFFADNFGDSRAVFRMNDEKEGVMIGKGSAPWTLNPFAPVCSTAYHVRFAAKDGKARLQFELIEGVPAGSQCTGWPWPSRDGYNQIVSTFHATAQRLERALKGDQPSSNFKNF